ncbi:MAG: helicase associated domain-containing protein, partial [Thermodesulfovibrionales bacterium]|nr:helicase associated domain-containing protein [Thermodesulfovibrionales bacterium]
LNVPRSNKKSEWVKLGQWQSQVRRQFKRGNLTSDRIQRLNAIGFAWDTLDEAFEKRFQETLRYKEQFGTPNVPRSNVSFPIR